MQLPIILLTIFFTGAAGLIYEVAWHRYLTNLIGSQSQATALTLAVFLGGLSVGYWMFGKLSRRKSHATLLRLTALTEIGVALWALVFLSAYSTIWNRIGVLSPSSPMAFALDLVLTISLIGVPTILMGGTLPLLTQGLSRNIDQASTVHAFVYGINTIGAFSGCLLVGFILIPWLGLTKTIHIAAIINACAGLTLFVASLFAPSNLPLAEEPVEESDDETEWESMNEPSLGSKSAAILAFVAGFCSIAIQTTLIRMIGLSMGSSEYAFTMIVSVFILMLGAGSIAFAKKSGKLRNLRRNQFVLLFSMAGIYLSLKHWGLGAYYLRNVYDNNVQAFYVYHATALVLVSVILAIPVGCMGRTMPLVFSAQKTSIAKVGSDVGRLYCLNSIGCAIGALCGGYLLLYVVNIEHIMKIAMALIALSLAVACGIQRPLFRISIVVLAASIVWLPAWDESKLAKGLFRTSNIDGYMIDGRGLYNANSEHSRVIFRDDDPNTSVSVIANYDDGVESSRSILVNGKSDGDTSGGDRLTTMLLAHIPALLKDPTINERVAVIGFGTGITVGTLALYDNVSNIDVIEISTGVRKAAPLFDRYNFNASQSLKVQWHMSDAYRVLGASSERYSFIVSEPSNPWVSGVEKLYAKEFYDLVKTKLTPGGLYAQWFHVYSLRDETFGMVMNTFTRSFPYVRLFHLESDVILLGSNEPISTQALAGLSQRMAEPKIKASLKEIESESPEKLLAMESWIAPNGFDHANIHSLENPKLAFAAGVDFFLRAGVDLSDPRSDTDQAKWPARPADSLLSSIWLETTDQGLGAVARRVLTDFCTGNDAPICEDANGREWMRRYLSVSSDPIIVSEDTILFLQGSPLETDEPQMITTFLQTFGALHSSHAPFDAEAVKSAATICLEQDSDVALLCRETLVLALFRAGFLQESVDLYGELYDRKTGVSSGFTKAFDRALAELSTELNLALEEPASSNKRKF